MPYDDPYGDDLGAGAPRGQQRPKSGGGGQGGGKPNLGNYVEVKDRIQQFYAKYPTGAIVTEKIQWQPAGKIDEMARVIVQAAAYRTPDDPHPGRGSSAMVLPGKTPYTAGSELENTETSAWGRAVAAVGVAVDRGISTASEIRSKGGEGTEQPSTVGADALREAAAAAAGEPEPAPVAPEPTGATETAATPASGTEARSESELPTEAVGEADVPGYVPNEMGDPMPAEAVEVERDEDGKVKSKRPAKTKAPTPDPEAAPAPAVETDGLPYDEFIRIARERFYTNGLIQSVARKMVESGALPQTGSVRELTDNQRTQLLFQVAAESMNAD